MFSARTNWKLTRNRLTEALEEVRLSGAHVLDLTVSNPTRAGLRYDNAKILQSLASPQSMDYDPQPKGLRNAREAVAAYYQTEHGIHNLDIERIILTTSTSEGYSFVFRLLCHPGDELLVPKPSYPLFEFLADLQDVKLVPYTLIYDHGWQMDLPSLQRAVTKRTRGIVVVHPNNPTGSFVHSQEQAPLNILCREHGLALIADEVFLDYSHDGATPQSFSANADVLTFTLSGSPGFAPHAWRIKAQPVRMTIHQRRERLGVPGNPDQSLTTGSLSSGSWRGTPGSPFLEVQARCSRIFHQDPCRE